MDIATHTKDQPAKLDLSSLDVARERCEDLVRLFPEARTEGNKIDFEQLKRALGETIDVGRERYGLVWPGKAECFKTIQTLSVATLRPAPDQSVNFDTTKNLIIEGDNLEVLKLLQKSYLGKVKLIYIDPPYNTGNDFIYPDNYAEGLQTYLQYTGQVDAEGRKFGTNTEAEGRFHSKWLNMMYPRLYLAKNLLCDEGVIFITMNDVEIANLRQLCNDVFGEENFVATIIWQKKYSTKADSKYFSESHDYILVYARELSKLKLLGFERTEEQEELYQNPDDDPRGPWASDNLLRTEAREYAIYEITGPTGKTFLPPAGSSWRFNRDKIEQLIADHRIWFGKTGDSRPRLKRFRSEVRNRIPPQTLWSCEQVGHTDEGTKELAELFGGTESPFPNPKPSRLIRRMAELATDSDSIVLDFFAGSGTTGQSILDLNVMDGGSRKFILVQLPEKTERGDFSTIADITKERIRRVITKISENQSTQLKLQEGKEFDLGFRVFKLAESNFKTWDADQAEDAQRLEQQLEMHVDHLRDGRNANDFLFEILFKSGFQLTAGLEVLSLGGLKVFSVAGGALLVCLERNLTLEGVRAMAEKKPERVVCLDEGFAGNDQLKTNAVQTFKAKGIVFRTV